MAYAPHLTEAQIDRIRVYAKVRQVAAGEVLYQPGSETPPVFVVCSGAIRIIAIGGKDERTVTTYRSAQFSGELLMISGRRSIYGCQAIEDGTLLELSPGDLRTLIARDAELSEIIMNAFLTRRLSLKETGQGNVVVLGSKYSAGTLLLREFLTRDGHPFTYFDLDSDPSTQDLLDRFGVAIGDIPVVICNNSQVLKNPSTKEVAECLGFNRHIDNSQARDLVIVGAGPAGLAAAVYAASEGLDVLVVERTAPGGQAGSSSKIENYLGFPTGLSGQELADRAIAQAEKFGARIMVARSVKRLNCDQRPYRVTLDDGQEIPARTIVLATGAQYNKPALAELESFSGQGIYYNATFMESQVCANERVIVIGGGNSAGQAAVFLAQNTAGVTMLVRSSSLVATMSRYLIQRIEENPRIQVHYCSELTRLEEDHHLEKVTWAEKAACKTTVESVTQPIRHVFVMTGASPQTAWLSPCLALDAKGFVLTGRDLDNVTPPVAWPLVRAPHMLETSLQGYLSLATRALETLNELPPLSARARLCFILSIRRSRSLNQPKDSDQRMHHPLQENTMTVSSETGLHAMQYKTIDGLRIRFATSNRAKGDPILLLSPLPESILAFLPTWDTFAALGPVVAVDLPPFGRSEVRAEARTPEKVGEFVVRIMEAFGLDRPHVIAPDIGTPACLFAAANHPGVFRSLVIGSGATDHTDILGDLDRIVNAPSLEPFKDLTGEQFVRAAVADMKKYKLPDEVLLDYIASYSGQKFWDAMTFVRDYPHALPRLASRLAEVTVPCQLTVGRHDPFVPVSNAQGLHRRLPKSRLDVVECGHFVWEEAPEIYGTLAREFIRGGYTRL